MFPPQTLDPRTLKRQTSAQRLQLHTMQNADDHSLDLTDHIAKVRRQYVEGGSFGDVYKCYLQHGSSTKEVAVKAFRFRVNLEGVDDPTETFRGELRRWRRLEHKNVVPFFGITHGFGIRDSTSLVSLWMPNGTLGNFLVKYDDRLCTSHRLCLLMDIANGLHYLHSLASSPIIHGDLNPNNILLDGDYTACLTDYGYASSIGATSEALAYLQGSSIRSGSLRWIAPEQVLWDSKERFQKTTKTDIYSFGNVTFQILSGKQPWSEIHDDTAVVLRLAQGRRPERAKSRPIEEHHWEFINLCWSPSQEQRPTSGQIVSTVERFLHQPPPAQPIRDLIAPLSRQVYPHRPRVPLTSTLGSLEHDEIQNPDDNSDFLRGENGSTVGRLEDLGDTAMDTEQLDVAIAHYSAALSLGPAVPQRLLLKRSKVYTLLGLWSQALEDANKVIILDRLSPWGYERKHAALHLAHDYENAIHAFETMLSKILHSPDIEVHEYHHQYVNPAQTKVAIRGAIQDAIRLTPRVLINTISGRLLDKSAQAASFESIPVFHELISSMTTHIDNARIEHDVTQYYRYAMFSHKWADNEPLYEAVINVVVYDLEESLTHNKLQMFCKIAREDGLHWAWSDTCCIDRADHGVLQEALVSMFQWYQNSVMTIVLLGDVDTPSRRGDLVKSIWNTRAWTLQEYLASKVVRFYTKDWAPYLDLDIPNHKESPTVTLEMEEATGISTQTLSALRPGSDKVREKLHLASTRQTTRVEDTAYSLFGIFSLSLPVAYGEGDRALGRLLAELLAGPGDTAILAWKGRSGGFNSCLPDRIAVFDEWPSSHIPAAIPGAEMDKMTAKLRTSSSSLNLPSLMNLYDRLHELPGPSFSGQRLRLPCLAFSLGPMSAMECASGRLFHAKAGAFGVVEIGATEDLSVFSSIYLVYPWIGFLLDRQLGESTTKNTLEENSAEKSTLERDSLSNAGAFISTWTAIQTRAAQLVARLSLPFVGRSRDATSFPLPLDKETQAIQLLVRVRQPFGPLFLAPTGRNSSEFRRVASDGLITVRIQDDTPLNVLTDSVRILDVV